jgi:hypothetical protein
MKLHGAILVAAVAGALALPARGYAVDHVVLIVSPTRIAAQPPTKTAAKHKPSLLPGWRLSGRVIGATSSDPRSPGGGGRETFGVSLGRTRANGDPLELHGFRAAPIRTVTFDGGSGRWAARFGDVLRISMAIRSTGSPTPIGEAQGCRGAFAQVPVELRGTFVLRTRTAFFATIRRSRLAGVVTFNQGGPVDCTPAQPPESASCPQSRTLAVSRQDATLLTSSDSGGWATLSFADRRLSALDGATWYHVMWAVGFDPLAGTLPSVSVRLPGRLSIQGSGKFAAGQTSTETTGACRTVSATGAFSGIFRARFTGWGARTLRLAGDRATYREET